jgi:hypothetical protein
MYNIVQCSGLHGHVKVAPDGTVYVPNKNCPDPDMNATTLDGGQGFAVSEDNGINWTVRTLPGSGSGDNDPAIGIGPNGRIFFVYTASDKHIRAAVTDDKGVTWKYDQDLGLPQPPPTNTAALPARSAFLRHTSRRQAPALCRLSTNSIRLRRCRVITPPASLRSELITFREMLCFNLIFNCCERVLTI